MSSVVPPPTSTAHVGGSSPARPGPEETERRFHLRLEHRHLDPEASRELVGDRAPVPRPAEHAGSGRITRLTGRELRARDRAARRIASAGPRFRGRAEIGRPPGPPPAPAPRRVTIPSRASGRNPSPSGVPACSPPGVSWHECRYREQRPSRRWGPPVGRPSWRAMGRRPPGCAPHPPIFPRHVPLRPASSDSMVLRSPSTTASSPADRAVPRPPAGEPPGEPPAELERTCRRRARRPGPSARGRSFAGSRRGAPRVRGDDRPCRRRSARSSEQRSAPRP